MKDYSNEHELMRRKLWMQAWTYVAGASNCNEKTIPGKWADRALLEFDAKFPKLANDKEVAPWA